MRGWRIKFLFLLIVYFAGFATAVYCLAPVSEDQACESDDEKSFLDSALKSDDFAKSFNTGMHKCIEFSKNAASRTAKFIKQKLDERQLQTDG